MQALLCIYVVIFVLFQSYIPLFWVVGYTFGTMAGLLYCSAKLVEIFDSVSNRYSRKEILVHVIELFPVLFNTGVIFVDFIDV